MKETPEIIYEDNDIIIIDKPAGMIVNNVDTTKNILTVQEWVGQHLKIRSTKSEARNKPKIVNSNDENNFEFAARGGIVHRLDKETSGVLILAKNEESFENLKKQFKEKEVKKTYIALCYGEIKPSSGEINIPTGRLPWNRMRFGVLPQGRETRSKYKVLSIKYKVWDKVSEPLSLVEVYPETGRTHQIRVHMQYISHPIFADELYAGRKISKRDRKILPRHFLHASRIVFDHPRTGQRLEFESPLPPDLVNFLSKLGNSQV